MVAQGLMIKIFGNWAAVTPDNSNNLISLGGLELTTAKQVLGPSGSS